MTVEYFEFYQNSNNKDGKTIIVRVILWLWWMIDV